MVENFDVVLEMSFVTENYYSAPLFKFFVCIFKYCILLFFRNLQLLS